jgi:hypothetical protein
MSTAPTGRFTWSARVPMTSVMNRRRALPLVVALSVALAVTGPTAPASAGRASAAGNDMTPWTLPFRPPVCTQAQDDRGQVAGCLVSSWHEPDELGWPSPPFPSDPAAVDPVGVMPLAGWHYNGFWYNGSPAVADWEAQLAANTTAIGRVRADQLQALPDALVLFAGFLREIQSGGYKVSDVSAYNFRCTSSTSKSCVGLHRDSLSLHTWGLAIDMNSGANPAATYTGINGASACATPITTDIPMWVVRTAEKWGLYWGGYGWDSGCTSPDQVRTTATRDTTHFEFRGSVAQAQAIAAANLGGSCLDVADPSGTITSRCSADGVPGAGWRVVVDTGAPKGATAALVAITMTGVVAGGYVTAEGCGAVPDAARTTANGNAAADQTVSNLAVVPLDASGRFCLYRSQPMHTVVDVEGFYGPASSMPTGQGTQLVPIRPRRALDTRTDPVCAPTAGCASHGPVPGGSVMAVDLTNPPTGASAVLVDLAVTEPAAAGYLTADACAALAPGPQRHASGVFAAGATVAALAVVPVATSPTGARFCSTSNVAGHQVVDVQGWFTPPSADGLGTTLVPVRRLLDTRECRTDPQTSVQACATPVDPSTPVRIAAPAGASAVLVNLALTGAVADGFATAQPCSLLQAGPAGQSNGNVSRGGIVSNLAVVTVDADGTFCVRVSASMHVVVDLEGVLSPTGPSLFLPVAPVRRSDTRGPTA